MPTKKKPTIKNEGTIHGKTMRKSGSAKYSMQGPKPKNPVATDYKSLEYKNYENQVYIHRDIGDKPMPDKSTPPPYKKYNEKGEYIKHKLVATVKQEKKKEAPSYGMGRIMREAALSNSKKNKNGKKGK